jgi:hypothetical protein
MRYGWDWDWDWDWRVNFGVVFAKCSITENSSISITDIDNTIKGELTNKAWAFQPEIDLLMSQPT